MSSVLSFIEEKSVEQRQILYALHNLLEEFGLKAKLRYKIPFYDHTTWTCYLNPIKDEGVELCFLKGLELMEQYSFLDCKGRKMVAGIEFSKEEQVEKLRNSLIDLINAAIDLDEFYAKV